MCGLCGVWLRPVERTVRVREVPSSNLGTPTDKKTSKLRESFFLWALVPPNGDFASPTNLSTPTDKKTSKLRESFFVGPRSP